MTDGTAAAEPTRTAVAPATVTDEAVPRRWLALAVLALAQVVLVLDSTVVNVALPSIQRQFDLTSAHLAWIVNLYALAFGGFLLVGGRLADLYGRRRLFLIGIGIFSGASLLAGLAWNADVIVAMRFVQGLGAAIAAPAALSSVSRIFTEPKERATALGIWGGLSAFGATIGAVLSGVLTEFLTWRWVFLITVPITLIAMVLAPRLVPESRSPDHPRLDVVGSILVTAGIGTAVFALLDKGEDSWTSGTFVLRIVVAAVLLAAFVLWELRSRFPMVPLGIFRNRNRVVGVTVAMVFGSILTTYFFSTTLYMQTVLGFSPLQTGFAYLAFGGAVLINFPLVTLSVRRFGLRRVMPVGLVVASIGMFVLTGISADGTYVGDVLPGMVLVALGSSCGFATFTIAGVDGTTNENAGIASGILNAGSQVGSALGLATFVAIAVSVQASRVSEGQPFPVATVEGFSTTYRVAAIVLLVAATFAAACLRPQQRAPEAIAAGDAQAS